MEYNKISVKSKEYVVCLIILMYIAYLIMCVCTCALLKYFDFPKYVYLFSGLTLIVTIITIILIIRIPELIYKSFGYYIDNKKVESRSGIFITSTKIVTFKNIYKLEIKKNIISRIFKISTLILSTKAGNIKIYMLDEKSLEKVYNKINSKIIGDI